LDADYPANGVPFPRLFTDNIGAALDLTVQPLDRVGAVQRGAVLPREVHIGDDVVLGGIYQRREPGHPRAQLVGHAAPLSVGGRRIGLGKCGASPGRHDAALGFSGMRRVISHEVDAAAPPGGAQDLGHRGLTRPSIRHTDG